MYVVCVECVECVFSSTWQQTLSTLGCAFVLQVPTVLVSLLLPSSVRRHRFINQARKIRRSDAIVIIIVTVVTLLVDLFTAVAAGILFTAAAYAWESGHQLRGSSIIVTDEDGTERKVIRIDG